MSRDEWDRSRALCMRFRKAACSIPVSTSGPLAPSWIISTACHFLLPEPPGKASRQELPGLWDEGPDKGVAEAAEELEELSAARSRAGCWVAAPLSSLMAAL